MFLFDENTDQWVDVLTFVCIMSVSNSPKFKFNKFKIKISFKGSNETEVLVDSKQVPQTSPALL